MRGSAHQLIADVESRLDDLFSYPGGQVVHLHVFAAQLRRDRGIIEYQVCQTPAGAEVLVVGTLADPAATGRLVAAELAAWRPRPGRRGPRSTGWSGRRPGRSGGSARWRRSAGSA